MAENNEDEEILESVKLEDETSSKDRGREEDGESDAGEEGEGGGPLAKLDPILNKVGLSRKLALIIVAVLLVLLLALAAYLVFMAKDETVDLETVTEVVDEELIIEPEEDGPPSKLEMISNAAENASVLGDDTELATEEDAAETDAGINEELETTGDVTDTESSEVPEQGSELDELKKREESLALREENLRLKQQLMDMEAQQSALTDNMPKSAEGETITDEQIDKYIRQYESRYGENPSAYEPKKAVPPQPRWGEFAPIYREKSQAKTTTPKPEESDSAKPSP